MAWIYTNFTWSSACLEAGHLKHCSPKHLDAIMFEKKSPNYVFSDILKFEIAVFLVQAS